MQEEIFSRKLKSLRNQQGITQAEMARELHVSRSCIANYEKGERQPDMEGMRHIAAYFHVSTDYLMGNVVSDEKPERFQKDKVKEPVAIDISVLTPEERVTLLSFYRYLQKSSL